MDRAQEGVKMFLCRCGIVRVLCVMIDTGYGVRSSNTEDAQPRALCKASLRISSACIAMLFSVPR